MGRAVLARMPGGRQEASMGFLGLLVVGSRGLALSLPAFVPQAWKHKRSL